MAERLDQKTFATSIGETDIFLMASSSGAMKKVSKATMKEELAGVNSSQVLEDEATITWDLSLGNIAEVTLGGDRSLILTNSAPNSFGLLKVKQDEEGERTLSLPGNVPPDFELSTGADEEDLLGFFNDGVNVYWTCTNYGTVVGGGGGFDLDAQAFFDEITSAGASLSGDTKNAINTFVLGMKAEGLWDKMDAIYPFAGSTSVTQRYNLKDPRNDNEAYRLSFSGTWIHDATGADAVTAGTNYADTHWVPGDAGALTSKHFSVYPTTNPTATNDSLDFGSIISGGIGVSFISVASTSTFNGASQSLGAKGSGTAESTDARAFWVLNRPSSGRITVWKDGSSFLNNGSASNQTGTVGTSVLIGAYRSNGTPGGGSHRKYCFASFGDGLTDGEVATFADLVDALKTGMGR